MGKLSSVCIFMHDLQAFMYFRLAVGPELKLMIRLHNKMQVSSSNYGYQCWVNNIFNPGHYSMEFLVSLTYLLVGWSASEGKGEQGKIESA